MRLPLFILFLVFSGGSAFAQTLYTFNGGGTSGNWEDASSWTTDPTGSTSVSPRTPRNGDNVVVTNSYVLLLNSNVSATGLTITIQKGGMLDLPTATSGFANTLTRLAGQGTLRISRPYFPTVTNNDFDDANTGTVEFYNWAASPSVLPNPASGQYNNLRLLNTTTTAYTAQLDNDLTLTGDLTLTRTNNAAVTLKIGKASTARTLSVLGNVTVNIGTVLGVMEVDLPASNGVQQSHTLSVAGSFTNNGTVNLHNDTSIKDKNNNTIKTDTQAALLNFTGGTDANFACNGPTDLGILQVNKGTDSQVLLNVTAKPGATASGNLHLNYNGTGDILVLINGVAKFGTNIKLDKIHNGNTQNTDGWFSLGSSATSPTLWIAGAQISNNNAAAFIVYGTYRISGVGSIFSSMTPDAMVVREDGQILIEGGTTSVNKLRPSSTSANHRGSFIMTGGVFQSLGTVRFDQNDNFARFSVPYVSQSFRMSGGTIQVQNPAAVDGSYSNGLFHIGSNPNNVIVSGGTIELTLPASSTAAANVNGNILSTAPLWNLTIKKAGTAGSSTAVLGDVAVPTNFTSGATTTAQPLTVLNNLTIDGTNPTTFDANGKDVTIQGSFNINSGSTYLPGTNTTTFSGGQDQLLTNSGTIGTATANVGTFANWTVNKSAGTLTLAGANSTFATTGTLALLSGVLNDGGKTINAKGNVINSASHTSGGGSGSIVLNGAGGQTVSGDGTGVFGNLKVNSTATAGTVAATLTANMSVASVLTLQSNHILAIGANRLALTNVSVKALAATGGFSKQRMILTAGNQSDLGLQKTFGGSDSFIYPVGTATTANNTTTYKYTPATIQLELANPIEKYGQVSVSPTNARSPFVASKNNSLAYYWKVRSANFSPIPAGSINATFEMVNSDAAGTLANYIPGRYLPVAWTKYNDTNLISQGDPVSDISFNRLDQFDGEFTAGEPSTFGPITAFYSRGNGQWADKNTWSTAGFNGAAATTVPSASNPVFIGSASSGIYHTVTVAANGANSGSLVIDRGSIMDVGVTTGHNFGALPDAKVGGAGRLRVSTAATNGTVAFPGGDFGSFLQQNGGTVEYYTTNNQDFTLPTASGTLTLNQYRNLWLNAANNRTITLPNQDLRVYAQLKTGVPYTVGTTNITYPGTVLLSAATNGDLRVDSLIAVQAGVLRYANGTARTLTADTDVRIDEGGKLDVSSTGTAVVNALTVSGSLTNNGALDFNLGNNRIANLTFLGAGNTYFTGTNAKSTAFTDLYTLTVNKGLGQAATLNLDIAGSLTTPTRNWLTLTNGTLRYAKNTGTLTIHDDTTPYLITDNAALTVDAPSANVTVATGAGATTDTNNAANNTSSPSDLKLAGTLQVLQGTLSVGSTSGLGNDLEYASAGAPTIRVGTGGTLYVNGQIRRTTANTNGSLRYDQTGGTVNIDGARATVYQNNERGLFEVQGPGSIFRMSGGTLNLRGSNGRPTIIADLYVRPDSTVVTAGTMLLGNNAAGNLTVSVESLVPLWDLKVLNGTTNGTNTGLLTGVNPLRLQGSLTIDGDYAFFNANGLGLSLDQNLVNNNTSKNTDLVGSTGGGFQPGTAAQTTTFTGLGPALQKLTYSTTTAPNNLTVFGGLVVNNAQTGGTLQLDRNARVAGTLNIAKGTLADNGQTLTSLGDIVNSALHTSTGSGSITLAGTTNQNIDGNDKGRFGNVVLNNSAGATTLSNQEITSVLTLTAGVLTIGSNQLTLSNPAAGAVTGYSATRFIRTNGIVADLGLRKSYPSGASDFTFPVGAASKYTPVRLNVTANSAAGTLAVKPVDLAHPSTTDPAAKELTYFWKISSTGFSNPTVDQVFTYIDNGTGNDVNGTEANYKLGRFYQGAWTPLNGIAGSSVSTTANTLTNTGATYFDGDYTGGETSEFGKVPTFYSRNSTAGQASGANWNDPTAWTPNADGSDPSPATTTTPTLANPVVIRAGHLINSNGASRGAATLQLLGTLDLSTYGANNFSTVTGTGTVRIGSALFPAGNYSDFVAAGGGTVEYTGAVQLPARDTYNNLRFSANTTKQLSNLDLTINGALEVAAGTVNNPTNQNIALTSATSGATLNGTFNLGDGNFSTTAFLTNGGTLNLGAGLLSVGTALNSSGTLNNGSGDVTVGTSFGNSGTYNANVAAGNLSVGTTFTNDGNYNAGTGKLTVNGDFLNSAVGTFTAANGDVTVLGNFSNASTYNYVDGTAHTLRVTGDFSNSGGTSNATTGNGDGFLVGTSNLVLRGNFINSAGFNAGKGQVQFITDDSRTLTGSTTFWNVIKQGASPLTLGPSTNMTVGGLLTMRSGLITTGTSNIVDLTSTSTQPITGATTGSYINGRLQMLLPDAAASIRTFPVGLGGRYRPVIITPQAASSSAKVLVEIFNSPPQGTLDATMQNMSSNRYYRVQLQSGSIGNPTVQLSFNTDVVDEQVTVPGNLRVAKSSGAAGPWTTTGGSGVFSPDAPRGYVVSAPTNNGTSVVTANSFFALASTNQRDNPLTPAAPLPVELVAFAAVRQGEAVRVAWATASEQNSSHFLVQRSADGRTFANVQRVAAKGSSATRSSYATLDATPLPGLSYYRLQQVDLDGTAHYSPSVAVHFEQAAAQPTLAAYPNPATSQGFQLQATNLPTAGGTIRLFDTTGRLVLTQTVAPGAAEAAIQPTQPLANGLYFATWQTPDGQKLTTKVLVE